MAGLSPGHFFLSNRDSPGRRNGRHSLLQVQLKKPDFVMNVAITSTSERKF
jgi:hypothetical protein